MPKGTTKLEGFCGTKEQAKELKDSINPSFKPFIVKARWHEQQEHGGDKYKVYTRERNEID